MSKKVCIIHTETTGLHELGNDKVYKKNLYGFSRLVSFHWCVGKKVNNTFVVEKNEKFIIKPRCMNIDDNCVKYHGISQEIALKKGTEIETVLEKFKNDLKDIQVIVSHTLGFHLKAVQAELVRYNMPIDFNKYVLIDINFFNHNVTPNNLKNLSKVLINKNYNDKANVLEIIAELFNKLYSNYEEEIKKS